MYDTTKISTGLEFVPKFDVTRRLKGGWFCGPEEYESMGFTLGLPPGLYLPETQESSELVEKIKPMNGMIMPSFYMNKNFDQKENRNLILISNIPPDVTQDDIINEINKRLVMAHFFPNADSNSSFVTACQIVKPHFLAYVKMLSSHVTEKAVSLNQLEIKGNIMPISYPDFILKDSAPLDKLYTTIRESQLCVVLEFDHKAAKAPLNCAIQLPSEEAVNEYFKEYVTVNRIYRPSQYQYILLYLNSVRDVDTLIINHQNCVIDNIPIVIHRSSREAGENECYFDPIMKEKILKEAGKSQYLTVLSPFMNQLNSAPSIADIFDSSMQLNSLIKKETEESQTPSGPHLLIFNIIQDSLLSNQNLMHEIQTNIFNECNKYGKAIKITIGYLFKDRLSVDSPVACVSFETPDCAKAAQIGISGRRFRGRVAITQMVDKVPEFINP